MKNCRTSLFFIFLAFAIGIQLSAQQAPAEPLPTSGQLDGNLYKNTFFGMNYYIPEQWAAKASLATAPGAKSSYLLLLKRKAGDPLSTITVTAVDLSKYDGKLDMYMDERARMRRGSAEADMSINGIPVNTKGKAKDEGPELLIIGDRTYYRLQDESTGVTRVTVSTAEKGYAVVFDLVVPVRFAEETTRQLMDSFISLTFGNKAASKAEKK